MSNIPWMKQKNQTTYLPIQSILIAEVYDEFFFVLFYSCIVLKLM